MPSAVIAAPPLVRPLALRLARRRRRGQATGAACEVARAIREFDFAPEDHRRTESPTDFLTAIIKDEPALPSTATQPP